MKSAMKKWYITRWHRRRLTRFHRDYNDSSKFVRGSSARLFLEPAVPTEYFLNCWLRNLSICFSPFTCSLRSENEHIKPTWTTLLSCHSSVRL